MWSELLKRMTSSPATRVGAAALGIGGAVLGGTAAGLLWQLFRRPLPRTSGELAIEGVTAPVEVARDGWGVPRVRAQSAPDMWFGLGWCHGQDRLWQLDLYRRVAAGRLAELAGVDGLPADRLMRTLGLRRLSEQEARELDEPVAGLLEAYCDGVNRAAAAAPAPPAELQLTQLRWEPWTPADTLALGKLFAFGMSTNWERELLRADLVRHLGAERASRLDPDYPAGNPVALAPGEGFSGDALSLAEQVDKVREAIGLPAGATGSNNWAVSGARSATGGPLIAGDPHLPSSMPGFIYQASLELDGRFCRGGTMPGIPTVFFGQNPDVCWTFTNVLADVQDLFIERISGDEYEFCGERRRVETRTEEIRVRDRDAPVTLEVRSTHHGPIVNSHLGADAGQPLALRWTALDHPSLCASHFEVMDPGSGPELVDLLEPVAMPCSNLIWADRHGSIGYKLIGRLPARRGDCPDLPKPGWTGEFEWEGTVPYSEQPELTDPDAGYLVTANNRVAEGDFPHHISSDYLDGYRAARIEQLIRNTEKHDLDTFRAIQTDLYSIPGAEIARRLARIRPGGQREARAIERLRSWDGRLDPESIGATIYQAFLLRLSREVTRAVIGDRDLCERYLDRADNGFLAHVTSPWRWPAHLLALWEEGDEELIGGAWDALARESLRGALDDLERRYGPDPGAWRWGDVHELRFPHALEDANPVFEWSFSRALKAGGGQETVVQAAYDPNDPYEAIWAPAWRMVADPMRPERSLWQTFTGQSGHAHSRHYDDLQQRWLAGQMQEMAGEAPWEELTLVPSGSASPPPPAAAA